MIRINSKANFAWLENESKNLDSTESQELSLPLTFGSEVNVGFSVFVIQFIARWSRCQSRPILRIFAYQRSDYFHKFAGTPHGAAAIYFAEILRFDDGDVESRKLRSAIVPSLVAMQSLKYSDTMRGRGVHFACFSGAENEWIRPFYPTKDENLFRAKFDLEKIVHDAIKSFSQNAVTKNLVERIKPITDIVYELVLNTHEHGRFEEGRTPLNPSLRGLIIRPIQVGLPSEGVLSNINSAFLSYLHRVHLGAAAESIRNRNHIQQSSVTDFSRPVRRASANLSAFLEFNVYDTGIGLARHWRENNESKTTELTIEAESKFIKKCFEKGFSTKDIPHSGFGLSNCLHNFQRLNAFFVLRTGRHCMYQDFTYRPSANLLQRTTIKSDSPGTAISSEQVQFSPIAISDLDIHEISGTAYSIIIPLH
jgi:hypothetical protein